jgi:signal transduction histidine kinase
MAPGETESESNAPATPIAASRLADLERRLGELSAEIEAERAQYAQFEHAAAGRERQRIAQALHDTVCQSLSGVSLEAAVLSRELEATGWEGAPRGKALREMIRKTVSELHELVQSWQQGSGNPSTQDVPYSAQIREDKAGTNP